MRRREVILALGGMAAWPLVSRAQQPAMKTYRVGILWANAPMASASRFSAVRQSLRELGYDDGKNIVFEQRGPDRLLRDEEWRSLAAELVDKVDVILTAGTNPTRAAKSVAGNVPIVMTFVSDPIGSGFIASLSHPGGNITGLTNFGPEMSVKWLELIKQLIPNGHRICVLYDPAVRVLVKEMELAATAIGDQLTTFELENDDALENAFSLFEKRDAEALIVTTPPRSLDQQTRIIQFAATNRLPTVYWWREYVEAGGLAYYGPSLSDMYQRAAVYVDKILKGAKPANLPVEQPTRFDLVINLKIAKALDVEIPPTLIARAEVIE
jgi:putative tryptophan/tyrosine transport system substrate-binding protein